MNFRNQTLRTRLLVSFAGVALMLMLTAGVALRTESAMQTVLQFSTGVFARTSEHTGDLNTAASNMAANQRGLLLFTYAKDPSRAAECRDNFRRAQTDVERSVNDLSLLLNTAQTKQNLADIHAA